MRRTIIFAPRRFARLLHSDATSIGRDPVLVFAIALSTVPALGYLLGRDAMNAAALREFGVNRVDLYLAPSALLLPAFLVGWVTGSLLLEDRDEGTLLALDVTPVGKAGFIAYRVAVTTLVMAALTMPAAGVIAPQLGIGQRVGVTLLVASAAVLAALVLPAVARNKVEGLALTKLTNLAFIVPLLAVLPSPWRYVGGIVPTFWLGELLELSTARFLSTTWVLAAAVLSHLVWMALLLALLRRRLG